MKKQPCIHYDKENSYFYHLFIALVPFLFYGWYKNGILPFLSKDIAWFQMFRPLLFPIVGFFIGLCSDYLMKHMKEKKRVLTLHALYGMLLFMTIPLQANLFLVGIFVLLAFCLFSVLEKTKWSINTLLATKGLLILILTFICKVSYANATESTNVVFYSLIYIFFGRSVGGVASTSIFFMIIAYLFLTFDFFYKKRIPIYTFLSFTFLALILELITPTGNLMKFLLNPAIFFASIFFASEITSSPYTETGCVIYGVINGLLGCFLSRFFSFQEGIYLSILLNSLFVPVIDRISYKIEKKKHKFCRMPKAKKGDCLPKLSQNSTFVLPKMKK